MPTSGATPSQNPNMTASCTARPQPTRTVPSAIAVRKLSRLRVNPRMRRLPIMWSYAPTDGAETPLPRSATSFWAWQIASSRFPSPDANARLLLLRQREGEQRASLAGSEHPGQEPFRPRAPPGRHGDVLPSVDG